MENTHERVTKMLEGGSPIKVYSEEDAGILKDLFTKSYKRNAKVGEFTVTKVDKHFLVDYVRTAEDEKEED